MRHIFPSFGFVLFSVAFCILAGILLGIFLGQDSDKTMAGVSFGLASFSIVPITVCLFGLKEINTSFLGIMDELDRDLRLEINKYVSESSGRFLGVAFFFLVTIQVVFSFFLLYSAVDHKMVILGLLFGGILASLCYSVYVISVVLECERRERELQSKVISKKRIEDIERKFSGGINVEQN